MKFRLACFTATILLAGVANALTRVSGTQGTQFFREKKAYVADPAKFAQLALKSGFSANKAFAEAAKIAP